MTGWTVPPKEGRRQRAVRLAVTSIAIVAVALVILATVVVVFFGLIYGW
jgi:hypothetical protein